MILQRDDGGHHVAGLDAGVKALHLAVDDSFGKFRLLPAAGNMGGDRLLQIVNVVNEDAVQFVHLRVNIARDSNVDKEHGTILAAAEEHFAMLAAEDGTGGAGRGDHDVGAVAGFVEFVEVNGLAVEFFGKEDRTVVTAIGYKN